LVATRSITIDIAISSRVGMSVGRGFGAHGCFLRHPDASFSQ